MKERPILFSGEMVRAILDGRKTQTRRVVKPQPVREHTFWCDDNRWFGVDELTNTRGKYLTCPYGVPGDRLYVRESWCLARKHKEGTWTQHFDIPKDPPVDDPSIWAAYKATEDDKNIISTLTSVTSNSIIKWRPSIHMPKWASRIHLAVTDVRVDRLQEISGKDAYAEGFAYERARIEKIVNRWSLGESEMPSFEGKEIDWFHHLWDSINTNRGYLWDVNPWVWVVEFKVTK